MSKALSIVVVLFLCASTGVHASPEAIFNLFTGGLLSNETKKKEEEQQRYQDELKQRREALNAERERQDAELQAEYDRKEAAREARAGELKAGRIKPETIEDLEDLYEADDGWELANSPMLEGDKELYVVSGVIERPDAGVLLCATVPTQGKLRGDYFAVRMKPNTKKPADIKRSLRVNGRVFVVGRYMQNLQYDTVAAGRKIMPVLDAVHIIVPSN